MTVFIEPDKLICIFCNMEINKFHFHKYGNKTNKTVEKDGIQYLFCHDYYHNSCAIENLHKKESEPEKTKKKFSLFGWLRGI